MALGFEVRYREEDYYSALRCLLPEGPYWEAQLADEQSELSKELKLLAASVKAENDDLAAFMAEAFPHKAMELLSSWEKLAGLDAVGLSLDERHENLRRWRAGRLADFEGLASIVASYGMRLVRIEQPYVPFTMRSTFAEPMWSRASGDVRRLVVDPLELKVRPKTAGVGASFADSFALPLSTPAAYSLYAPLASDAMRAELQEYVAMPAIIEISYL